MGSAKEHSADEAGGEAVFSSDGLPSLSTPLPPPVVISSATAATGSSQSDDDNADAVIEESGVGGDVMDVFESFNTKSTNRGGGGWSVLRHYIIVIISLILFSQPCFLHTSSIVNSFSCWE